jgi:hypothetical protein
LEAQIQEYKAQMNLLKARARRVAAQGRIAGYAELAEADKHLEHVKAKFNELKGAGGGALQEIKTGMKKALADLTASTKRAAQRFNAPAQPAHAKSRARAKPAGAAKTKGR